MSSDGEEQSNLLVMCTIFSIVERPLVVCGSLGELTSSLVAARFRAAVVVMAIEIDLYSD